MGTQVQVNYEPQATEPTLKTKGLLFWREALRLAQQASSM